MVLQRGPKNALTHVKYFGKFFTTADPSGRFLLGRENFPLSRRRFYSQHMRKKLTQCANFEHAKYPGKSSARDKKKFNGEIVDIAVFLVNQRNINKNKKLNGRFATVTAFGRLTTDKEAQSRLVVPIGLGTGLGRDRPNSGGHPHVRPHPIGPRP